MRTAILVFVLSLGFSGDVLGATWYVDAFNGSEVSGDGSAGNPWQNLTAAYLRSQVAHGDKIVLRPGTYSGVHVTSKSVHIEGCGPDVCRVWPDTVAFAIYADNQWLVLSGLHIRGTLHGVEVGQGHNRQLYINNCVIDGAAQYGIRFYIGFNDRTSLTVRNSTIVGNGRDGIIGDQVQTTIITNCIIASNGEYGIRNTNSPAFALSHNNVFGNLSGSYSGGNTNFGSISQDPQFVSRPTGNYELAHGSPCRDSGDPSASFLDPDGTRNDMGAYGGPGSAGFFPDPNGGPIVTDLSVSPASVPRGEAIEINATGQTR